MFNKYSLTLLALFFSVPVYAAAPLITDDTGTQGKGKYQIELDYAAGVTTTDTGQELSTTLSLGIADNVDVIVELPYDWSPFTEEGRPIAIQQGIGDMAVDIKWRFLDNSKENGLSLAPLISPRRNSVGICAFYLAALLGAVQILGGAVAMLDDPPRTFG